MKHDITTRTISTLNAEGKHNSKHCRPVIIIEEGRTFTSIMDAAEYLGVNYSALWSHLDGRYKTCKRKHVRYADEYEGTVDELSAEVRKGNQENDTLKAENAELKAELAEWIEFKKQKEAERKAEEARKAAITKAREKLARRTTIRQRKADELAEAEAFEAEAQRELDTLLRELKDLISNANVTSEEENPWHA